MFPDHQHASARRGHSAWYYATLLLVGAIGIGWAFLSRHYYTWIVQGHPVDIVVFCDTSELHSADLKAFVLYDQIALTPLARCLGLYQNRPPDRVRVFFPMPAPEILLNPVSATLKGVGNGPLTRILFMVNGKKWHVNVTDRRAWNGVIYVRCPPDQAGQLPVVNPEAEME